VGLLRLGCFDGEVGGGGVYEGMGFERFLGGGVVRHKCSDISFIFSRLKRIVSGGRSIIYISPAVCLSIRAKKKNPPPYGVPTELVIINKDADRGFYILPSM